MCRRVTWQRLTGLTTTWRWTGSTWAVVPSLLNPGPVVAAGVAYEPVGQQLVLFGGAAESIGPVDGTWTFGPLGWLPAFPRDKPLAHAQVSMATDEADHAVMLFGGSSTSDLGSQVVYSDATWLWSGQNWRQLSLLESPSARSGAVLQPLGDGSILLFGGSGPGGFRTDTWTYGRIAAP